MRSRSGLSNRIGVRRADEADDVLLAVDDDGEEVEDVAAEDAHVEGRNVGEGGILAAEDYLTLILVFQANLRVNHDRLGLPAHSAKLLLSQSGRQTQHFKNTRVQYGSVGSRV